MFQIVRNAVMVVVMLTGAAINIYFDLLDPYVACGSALVAAYVSGMVVERLFIRRAYGKMTRLYGDDWAK
ncbi:hypothetical protein QA640_25090 [Bradyrhizobium sp. CB82]|uniref:hypothetical protein n=1 Tax=Bradyrhizobium sp. CB82 TaxID=3039159 RepID=UPI0024B06482|nr:hypothetical protein [Bradyrhizobium sp. CB82]WFU37739.1 hypothetical protein QA640_25090 [Bradyrhizobium sp. CB82]